MEQPSSIELQAAIARLWQGGFRNEEQALPSKEFLSVATVCQKQFGDLSPKAKFPDYKRALRNFFRNSGAPWFSAVSLSSETTAIEIKRTFLQNKFEAKHFCPLDFSVELPAVQFGPCEIRKFTETELANRVGSGQIERFFPNRPFDINRFSQFQWLVIGDSYSKNKKSRIFPWESLIEIDLTNVGRVFPHGQPKAASQQLFDQVLFTMALYPWEDVVDTGKYAPWCPFTIPWQYTISSDPFAARRVPPDPDTLSWEPFFIGAEEVGEQPTRLPIEQACIGEMEDFLKCMWDTVSTILPVNSDGSQAFNPLVKHFFLRGFQEGDFGQSLWHMVSIDAALGRSEKQATEKTAKRIAALLNDTKAGKDFQNFYDWRSDYIHGKDVRSEELWEGDLRCVRRLTRQVVEELLNLLIQHGDWSREDLLAHLESSD